MAKFNQYSNQNPQSVSGTPAFSMADRVRGEFLDSLARLDNNMSAIIQDLTMNENVRIELVTLTLIELNRIIRRLKPKQSYLEREKYKYFNYWDSDYFRPVIEWLRYRGQSTGEIPDNDGLFSSSQLFAWYDLVLDFIENLGYTKPERESKPLERVFVG